LISRDFVEGEEEIKRLKEKQKKLRGKITESVQIIKAIKQDETAAKSMLDQHRAAEDNEWTIYKENLARRNNLNSEKDRLFQERKNLKEQLRKLQHPRGDFNSKRDSLLGLQQVLVLSEQQTRTRDQSHSYTRTITEKKRPFEDEIMQCGVLLTYLERHESQAEPSVDVKEVGATNEVEGNELLFRGGGSELVPDEGIYHGVNRKPSKKERRRRQHVGETAKKLEHQIVVVEQFYSLGIQLPATVADIPEAKRAIREKKKFLRDSQKQTMDVMKMQRAKSNPYIASFGLKNKDTAENSETKSSDLFHEKNASKDDLMGNEIQSSLSLRKKHKSCPSIPGAMQLAELDSPYPSPSKEISASNSEYDLDSIGSIASSTTSMTDVKSNASEEKRKSLVVDEMLDFTDAKVESEFAKQSKGQHRVHFAAQVTVDQESIPNGDLEKEGGPFGNFESQSNGNFSPVDKLNNQMPVGDMKPAMKDQAVVRNEIPSEERFSKLLVDSEYQNGISFSNPSAAARRNRFSNFEDDDDEESEDRNSLGDDNELQFEMEDIPSRLHSGHSHLGAQVNGDDALSDGLVDMDDDFNNLQFQMDETDNNCAAEQRVNDSFSTLHQRSSGSCSPRRT